MPGYTISTECYTIDLGWISGLKTYFAEVWKADKQTFDRLREAKDYTLRLLQVGMSRGEIESVEALADLIKDYCEISDEFMEMLEEDRKQYSYFKSTPPTRGEFRPRTFLIVSNHKESATKLATLLTQMGHDVETAEDGPTALKMDATLLPDIVLIGRQGSQEMDGYTLARFIRLQPNRKVTLVTLGSGVDRPRAKKAGFRYHLTELNDLSYIKRLLIEIDLQLPAYAVPMWVSECKEGIIKEDEFVLRVLEIGARDDPAEMAHLIPEEVLRAVRKLAEAPPTVLANLFKGKKTRWLTAERQENILKGTSRWLRFFNP